jgi:hypothetical protein
VIALRFCCVCTAILLRLRLRFSCFHFAFVQLDSAATLSFTSFNLVNCSATGNNLVFFFFNHPNQPFLERFDLLALVREEINLLSAGDMPVLCALHITDIIKFGIAVTTGYTVAASRWLQIPLSKVARLFPELSSRVSDAKWALTKAAMDGKGAAPPMTAEQVLSMLLLISIFFFSSFAIFSFSLSCILFVFSLAYFYRSISLTF